MKIPRTAKIWLWIYGVILMIPLTLVIAYVLYFEPDFELFPKIGQPPSPPITVLIPASKADQVVKFEVRSLSNRGFYHYLEFMYDKMEDREYRMILGCGKGYSSPLSNEEAEAFSIAVPLHIKIYELNDDKAELLIFDEVNESKGCNSGGGAAPGGVSRGLKVLYHAKKYNNYRYEIKTMKNVDELNNINVGFTLYAVTKYHW